MRLDRAARWFEVTNETPPRIPSNYELLIDALRGLDRPARREDIETALDDAMPKATLTRTLKEAVGRGDVVKQAYGLYQLAANAQMLTPIRDEHLSISPDAPETDSEIYL